MPVAPAADPAPLIAGWEAAAALPAPARAAVLLQHLGLVGSREAALGLPVGVCTGLAATAFADRFAPEIDIVLGCPGCGERLEATLDVRRLAEVEVPAADRRVVPVGPAPGLTVHTPTIRDLLAVAGEPDGVTALLARCLRHADGRPLDPAALAALTPADLRQIDAAATELAGPAGAAVATPCPGCGREIRALIDIGELLWEQAAAAARALLTDVVELARAFGWSERDVLALSPARRAAYRALLAEGAGQGPRRAPA